MNVELIDETGRYAYGKHLAHTVKQFLTEKGLSQRELTVVLMDDAAIARHNLADRGVEGPTDVLSYPTFEPDDQGFPEVPHLGDVLVSLDTAARQAPEHGHDLQQEVLVLVAHGITHLLGFDHQTDDEWHPFNSNQARMLELAAKVDDQADLVPEGVPADLYRAARQAFMNAYTPFSHFNVGAALRSKSGTIFNGANVENSSYGLTRCAEQSAVQAMVTSGQRGFTELVVYSASQPPASPCGGCRQVLFEFAPGARVWLVNEEGAVVRTTVSDLLPLGFRLGPDPDQ